jgi:flagellin-specific chaperone FliS
VSKERGKVAPVIEEAYSLRDTISKVTGVEYDIREALPDFPPHADHASWYLLGREFREPKGIPYASTIWEDLDGRVYLESMYVGNTTEWIGPAYGEAGIIKGLKIDYSNFDRAKEVLAEMFPLVKKRLDRYETIFTNTSSKYQVNLSLRCAGDMGGATFFIVAKIEGKDLTSEKKVETIKQNVEALKEAWRELAKYDRKENSAADG